MKRTLFLLLFLAALPASARAQSEAVEYYGLDAIGSVRVVFDQNGTVLSRIDYAPFGREVTSSGNTPDRKFAALFRDSEAGLDYAQARSYQVRTGRFSSPDPIYAGLFEPQLWNRYTYSLNNPLLFTDSDGLLPMNCRKEVDKFLDKVSFFCPPTGGGWVPPAEGQDPSPGGRRTRLPPLPPPPPIFTPPAPQPPPLPPIDSPAPTTCEPVTFKVTGIAPRQATGTTAITQTPRSGIPVGGVAIKPSNFGVQRINNDNRATFAGIRLHADWSSAAQPNNYTPAIPVGLPSSGPYIPVDVLGPRSVREEPGNQIDLYGYANFKDAFASTRFVVVTAVIPHNSSGVSCPQ